MKGYWLRHIFLEILFASLPNHPVMLACSYYFFGQMCKRIGNASKSSISPSAEENNFCVLPAAWHGHHLHATTKLGGNACQSSCPPDFMGPIFVFSLWELPAHEGSLTKSFQHRSFVRNQYAIQRSPLSLIVWFPLTLLSLKLFLTHLRFKDGIVPFANSINKVSKYCRNWERKWKNRPKRKKFWRPVSSEQAYIYRYKLTVAEVKISQTTNKNAPQHKKWRLKQTGKFTIPLGKWSDHKHLLSSTTHTLRKQKMCANEKSQAKS